MLELQIKERNTKTSLAQLRGESSVPAVLYGPQEDAAAVSIGAKEFSGVWGEAGGSAIVLLKGVGDDKEALIQDVAFHPVSGEVLHADFYVIERGKKLTVTVPLEYVGEAGAEKQNGVVVKILHEVEMEILPSKIPASIEVDLTKLKDISSTITIGDLEFPESAEIALDAGEAVASMSEVVEEPEEVEEERSIDDVEVEEKGKKEGGDEESTEGESEVKE